MSDDNPDLREWYSFRIDVKHDQVSYIHNWLIKNNRSTKHIIGLEEECKNSKNKQHLQCMIYIDDATSKDIRKNLCRQKYKLKGRATAKQASQYSVAPARDWRVLGAYVQKDQHPDNVFYNITKEEILEMAGRYKTPEQKIQDIIDSSKGDYKKHWKSNMFFEPGYSPDDKEQTKYTMRPHWIYANVLRKLREDPDWKINLTSLRFKNMMISLFFKNDLISPEELAYDHLSRFHRR